MFAQLKGTPLEYSVNDKLREIDVANENVHGSVDYTGKVSFFKCSEAYSKIVRFISTLNAAVKGKTMTQITGRAPAPTNTDTKRVQIFASDAAAATPLQTKADESKQQAESSSGAVAASDAEPTPSTILALLTMLSEVEELIAQCPPNERGAAAPSVPLAMAAASASVSIAAPAAAPAAPGSRFGSPAFRDFLTLLTERAPGIITRVLAAVPADTPAHAQLQRTIAEIDAPQSAESLAWEKQGFETLAEFKRKNAAAKAAAAGGHAHGSESSHGHAHGHAHAAAPHVHKLPPGVVISHGASGIGNPPKAEAESKHEHDHEHDHEHEHGASCASSSSSSSSAAEAAPADSSYDAKHARLVHHLTRYLVACWGDIRRLDYGTGHELHFMCLLSALGDCGLFDVHSVLHCERVVGLVFCKYLSLMRHLQSRYWLEPAGSRGVWGLDDYSFLPFLLGSSQLQGHKYIKPKSVRYAEILDGFAREFMYLDAIAFILQVKTCSFAEHSPMLNDITIIKNWDQVNAGLWKMYQAEVLGKFAVVQHFIYTPLLSKRPKQALAVQEADVKLEAPCCENSIRFPSALGAKATVQAPRV